MEWHCDYCRKQHTGNLLKKLQSAVSSVDDKNVLELLGSNGDRVAVLQVSKNKRPNLDLAKQYRETGTIFIQVCPPVSFEDAIDCLSKPRHVDFCINPVCHECGNYKHEQSLVIINSSCWKCHSPMKVAVREVHHYQPAGPDEFSDKELDIARNKGVLIQTNFSKTVGDAYLSNTCPHCEAMTGNFYLTEHLSDALYGYHTFEKLPQGFCCTHCDTKG